MHAQGNGACGGARPRPRDAHVACIRVAILLGNVGPVDVDIQFVAWTTAKLGSSVHTWLHKQLRAISLLSQAVELLQLALLVRSMPDDVRERAETWNVALIAAMVPLLRWLDRRLTVCFA